MPWQPKDKTSRSSVLRDGPASVIGQRVKRASATGVKKPEPTSVLSPSVNATVYEALKEQITGSQLRPGVKLIHQDLAERLQVSRTPVREALERLYQEGFVTRLPRRGFYVAEIDEEEARELYELREALELYALRRSMARGIKSTDLRRLDGFNRTYQGLVRDGATRERMIVDRDWHLALASLADNRALLRSLAAVFERLILKIRTDGYRTVRGAEALSEHVQMMEVLRAEDKGEAERLLAEHIQGARRRLASHLSESSD